jgi:SAM-dependent methyltransferase
VVGVAKKYSDWNCYGIDLSSASLGVARKLAKQHGVSVTLERGSYLDPLPFDCGKFDVISATGTIHHAADPFAAMRVLREALRDNGWLFLHLYGWRNDAIKFDIKEMLSIFQPDLAQHQERFELYRALIGHRRSRIKHRIATTTLADLYALVRNAMRNVLRRRKGESWSPGWDADYPVLDSPWIDHFCHPCERAYEVAEVQELAEETGFHVMHMLKQGKERPHLIPPKWQSKYDQLDDWSKWRLSELLSDGGGSFAVILKRA